MQAENIIVGSLILFATLIAVVVSVLGRLIVSKDSKESNISPKRRKRLAITDLGPITIGFIALALATFGFTFATFIVKPTIDEFLGGIQVELFGIIFDIIVLVIFANWVVVVREKREEIIRFNEQIDDYRYWRSEEARFRLRGIIRRLNKKKVTAIDLSFVDIKGEQTDGNKLLFKNVLLNGADLLLTELSWLNLSDSQFAGCTAHSTKFNESVILRGDFQNAHIQGAEFEGAYLGLANFDGAVITGRCKFQNSILTGATFMNCTIESAYFANAEVDKEFLTRMESAGASTAKAFSEYRVAERRINPNATRYFLRVHRLPNN